MRKLRMFTEVIIEKITGKECVKCKYKNGIFCENEEAHEKCSGLFPRGFERKER